MKMIMKAFFIDIDCTLLCDDKTLSERNRKALHDALDKGNKIILSTGRSTGSAITLSKMLGLNRPGCYALAFNGCVIVDLYTSTVIATRSQLEPFEIHAIGREACRRGIHAQIYTNFEVITVPRFNDALIDDYCQKRFLKKRIIDDFDGYDAPSCKLLLTELHEYEKLVSFREFVLSGFPECDAYFSDRIFLEVVKKGIDKGAALHILAELLKIPVCDTVAVGDAENDIPMIKAAGIGFAMKNAADAVKASADRITLSDNNHDAIAEIIEFCENEEKTVILNADSIEENVALQNADNPEEFLANRTANSMKVIGITGGVGSGKSYIIEQLCKDHDVCVISTDEIAREQMKKGGSSFNDVVSFFGEEILQEDGEIDRKALSSIVFNNSEKLAKLNDLTHPSVIAEMLRLIEKSRLEGCEMVFIETALLIEAGIGRYCDEIWYVTASPDVRRKRLKDTRGYSDERIDSMLSSQKSEEEFRRIATRVIENNG